MQYSISWESFSSYNMDARGINFKFEDLCRQLFANEYLPFNERIYLHCNPNNPGIEADPIFDTKTHKRVGFQVKYFENSVDYTQIRHSAEKTIEFYENKIDHIVLFCNKSLTTESKGFVITKDMLSTKGITITIICNEIILDIVRQKYPYLGLYYFGNHTISREWLIKHTTCMLDSMGERYNRNFNIGTRSTNELSLFVHDSQAANYLNNKKKQVLLEVERLSVKQWNERRFLESLDQAVRKLEDVDVNTLSNSIKWQSRVESEVDCFLSCYRAKKEELETEAKKFIETTNGDYHNIRMQIRGIVELIDLPRKLGLNNLEQQLLENSVLCVYGSAGMGKSHLLANEIAELIREDRFGLLLLGENYLSDESIYDQIMKNLQLDFSFDELIDILEAIGEKEGRIVPILIDALNETWKYRLWKVGLPRIIRKINDAPMVKIVFSLRSEYMKIILPDSIHEDIVSERIASILQNGFSYNGMVSINEFLNNYNIPFSPLEILGYEMSNPLLLTLYCRTYSVDNGVSLPSLYERVIEHANKQVYRALECTLSDLGYTEDINIVNPLVFDVASFLINNNRRIISESELCELPYWTKYQVSQPGLMNLLIKERLFYDTVYEDDKYFYFSFDQMNDYYCARSVLKMCSNKEDVRKFAVENLLGIRDSKINNPQNIDFFINLCAIFAEKYGEECVDIISNLNESDKAEVFSRYLNSFQWRKSKSISKHTFLDLINHYPFRYVDLWAMLIGNSVKITNPLNADFLHQFLSSFEINERDYLWTIYINELETDDRVIQLVKLYNTGKSLDTKNERQLELLLTLFGWLLTSSNRFLRDNTSKAMIEILKCHFNLSIRILKKFQNVNDPYIIQRLYGIVFGACCKKQASENHAFFALASYTYDSVFNCDKVYPDILLRDYARMIIELFLKENPGYANLFDCNKIVPPYTSDPIPVIDEQYLSREYKGCMYWLISSMKFEGMGMYGDFGRYIFQSALRNFDVDETIIFNYAIHYIINCLGYSEKYFDEYDSNKISYNRGQTVKIERIGKKYQWIAMHNILARVSDHYKMLDSYGFDKKRFIQYEGAWEPCVRDFDPTINKFSLLCPEPPKFEFLDEFAAYAEDEIKNADLMNLSHDIWLNKEGFFHKNIKDTLHLKDGAGTEWIALTSYRGAIRRHGASKKRDVWSWMYAYFVHKTQRQQLVKFVNDGISVIDSDIASHHDSYYIYNREYPWSPSCKQFNEFAWVDASVRVGPLYVAKDSTQKARLRDCEYDDEKSDTDVYDFSENAYKKILSDLFSPGAGTARSNYKEVRIGKILRSTSCIMWESGYDGSIDETLSFNAPCHLFIERLNLRQRETDGFFYDNDGRLAAFDVFLTQKHRCVVVRKDLLDTFLRKTGLELVWLAQSQKEIYNSGGQIQKWSNWEAIFTYDEMGISGSFHVIPND